MLSHSLFGGRVRPEAKPNRVRIVGLVWLGLSCVALGACGPKGAAGGPGAVQEHQAPAPPTALRDRAERLWQARLNKDWTTVFVFQDPQDTQGAEVADFVTWCEQEEPFRVESFEFGQVLVEGDMGWVEVRYRARIAKFMSLPPRDATQWEKWLRSDGQWGLVSRRALDSVPASPALRDAQQEARLRARFEEAWVPRLATDWGTLYAMTDPQDRAEVDEDTFARGNEMVGYLDRTVHWVQVIGDSGTIRVSYEYKLNDPSLTKLPPQVRTLDESWVQRDGEWYLDLKPQVKSEK